MCNNLTSWIKPKLNELNVSQTQTGSCSGIKLAGGSDGESYVDGTGATVNCGS